MQKQLLCNDSLNPLKVIFGVSCQRGLMPQVRQHAALRPLSSQVSWLTPQQSVASVVPLTLQFTFEAFLRQKSPTVDASDRGAWRWGRCWRLTVAPSISPRPSVFRLWSWGKEQSVIGWQEIWLVKLPLRSPGPRFKTRQQHTHPHTHTLPLPWSYPGPPPSSSLLPSSGGRCRLSSSKATTQALTSAALFIRYTYLWLCNQVRKTFTYWQGDKLLIWKNLSHITLANECTIEYLFLIRKVKGASAVTAATERGWDCDKTFFIY